MKKIIPIAILLLFTFQYSFAQKFTEYYFKFKIQSKSEIEKITRIISIDNVKDNTVYAYANDTELAKFKTLGYKIEYLQKDVPKALTMATTVDQMANWDRYPTYEVYRKMMKNFEVNYPTLCKLDSIGTTVDGRKLYVIKISDNVNVNETEPEFFYTSTMHGDEATGFILMLRYADSLLTSYGNEATITNLVDNIEIFINPNANPDGTYNGGNSTVSGSTRYNGNGVDLNRNFKDPVDGDHPDGESWQPETVAMMTFANNHKIVMSANFHGGIELANYPWDNWSRRHADDEWFIRVSRNYATSAQENSPAGYFDDLDNGITNGYDWYAVAGGRQDYFTYFHNCREVTMEISNTKLVSSSSLPAYWNYNKDALLQFMKECTYGIHGTTKNSDGEPVKAMIFIENHDQVNDSSMVFSDSEIGDYHRLIEPGIYDITASANGYSPITIYDVQLNSNSTLFIDFVFGDTALAVIPSSISDTLLNQQSAEHNVILYNIGINSNNYTASIENPTENTWININKDNGVIGVSSSDTLLITLSNNSLSSGNYSCNLIISEEDEDLYTIPINLNIPDTSLIITPLSVSDSLVNSETSIHKIFLFNNWVDLINYTVSIENATENPWISINKSNGTIDVTLTDSILVTLSNNSLVAGNYSTNLIITENGNDTYIIPVNMNVPIIESINDIQSEFNYSIYPNPFSSDFAIDLSSGRSSFIIIQLFDYTGNLVYEKTLNNIIPNNRYLFNESFSDLNTGIYFLKISTLEGSKSKKVIKIQR